MTFFAHHGEQFRTLPRLNLRGYEAKVVDTFVKCSSKGWAVTVAALLANWMDETSCFDVRKK